MASGFYWFFWYGNSICSCFARIFFKVEENFDKIIDSSKCLSNTSSKWLSSKIFHCKDVRLVDLDFVEISENLVSEDIIPPDTNWFWSSAYKNFD